MPHAEGRVLRREGGGPLFSSGAEVPKSKGALGPSGAASRATPQGSGWDLTSGEAFISRESCEAPSVFGNRWSEGLPQSAPPCALVQRLGPHLGQPLAAVALRCLSTATGSAIFTPPQASSAQANCFALPAPWPAPWWPSARKTPPCGGLSRGTRGGASPHLPAPRSYSGPPPAFSGPASLSVRTAPAVRPRCSGFEERRLGCESSDGDTVRHAGQELHCGGLCLVLCL